MTGRFLSPIRLDAPVETVQWRLLVVPLARPIYLGSVRITERQYLWVRVRDAEGSSGVSYVFTRGLPLDRMVEVVARIAVQANYADPGDFASAVHDHFRFAGPNGLVSRACGVVTLAM